MESEKIVAVLLIIAILFSVASIVFNLSVSDLKPVKLSSASGDAPQGSPDGNLNIVVERNNGSGQ